MTSGDVLLIDLASSARLFHSADGTAFADLAIDGHRETWLLRGKRFRAWLRQQYYERTWAAPSPSAISAALNVLEARAQFDGPERQISVRVADYDGSIHLDLADEFWRSVEISPRGWRIADDPPVRFRRPAGMLPLPLPVRGGSIEALAPFLNLASRDDFVLVVAWLLGALRASSSYPVLVISGEQGSAKTVLCKMLRALLDPNCAPVRTLPREERDLFIAANNGHLLVFDNLSGLPSWTSDSLCRMASGGGFAVRQLYTDQDEVLFDAARPVVLNGIEDVIIRPDLAERALFLALPCISEAQRRPEKDLWRAFELARPRLLGALLDAASHGLRVLPHIYLDRMPRMADFAQWAAACESGLWPAGTFLRAYAGNRRAAVESMIDADPVAACVREIMAERSTWAGTAVDLVRAQTDLAGGDFSTRNGGWPKNPRVLAGRLRRAQTALRTLGIEMTFNRKGRAGTRIIRMSKAAEDTVSTDSSVRYTGTRLG